MYMNSTQLLIANTIWFGMVATLIFVKDLSLWWFLLPLFFHWTESDLQANKQ